MCRLSWNLGTSSSWNPQGLNRPVMGLLYLYWSPQLHCDTHFISVAKRKPCKISKQKVTTFLINLSWHKSYNSFRSYTVYMKTFRSISMWRQQLSEHQINVNFNDVSIETQIICNLQCNVPLSWPPAVPLNCIQTNLKQTKTKFFIFVSSVTVHCTVVFTYFHYSTKYYERHGKLFIGRPCKKRADDLLNL